MTAYDAECFAELIEISCPVHGQQAFRSAVMAQQAWPHHGAVGRHIAHDIRDKGTAPGYFDGQLLLLDSVICFDLQGLFEIVKFLYPFSVRY